MPLNSDFHVLSESVQDLEKSLDRERAKLAFEHGTVWLASCVALGAIVLAFMALSLAITATGTARFAVAMNYPAVVGYAVGGIFDFAKELLPVGLILFSRRSFILFAIIGCAWVWLVIYSALATHATVSTAMAAIERSGAWKMEGRTNSKAELAAVEQRLSALSQPTPRPSKTLVETLAVKRCHPACGGIAKSANGSATASIFKLLARSSWIYAASWRQPRTTKNWTPVRGSCAKP